MAKLAIASSVLFAAALALSPAAVAEPVVTLPAPALTPIAPAAGAAPIVLAQYGAPVLLQTDDGAYFWGTPMPVPRPANLGVPVQRATVVAPGPAPAPRRVAASRPVATPAASRAIRVAYMPDVAVSTARSRTPLMLGIGY